MRVNPQIPSSLDDHEDVHNTIPPTLPIYTGYRCPPCISFNEPILLPAGTHSDYATGGGRLISFHPSRNKTPQSSPIHHLSYLPHAPQSLQHSHRMSKKNSIASHHITPAIIPKPRQTTLQTKPLYLKLQDQDTSKKRPSESPMFCRRLYTPSSSLTNGAPPRASKSTRIISSGPSADDMSVQGFLNGSIPA